MAKRTILDKDLKRIVQLEKATATVGQSKINLGLSVLFLIGVLIFAAFQTSGLEDSAVLIAAAIIGGYMALNIGANPRLYAITVALAASNTFIIPTHQVNALIYGTGSYSTKDFLKVGGGITLLFWIIMLLGLYLFY